MLGRQGLRAEGRRSSGENIELCHKYELRGTAGLSGRGKSELSTNQEELSRVYGGGRLEFKGKEVSNSSTNTKKGEGEKGRITLTEKASQLESTCVEQRATGSSRQGLQ